MTVSCAEVKSYHRATTLKLLIFPERREMQSTVCYYSPLAIALSPSTQSSLMLSYSRMSLCVFLMLATSYIVLLLCVLLLGIVSPCVLLRCQLSRTLNPRCLLSLFMPVSSNLRFVVAFCVLRYMLSSIVTLPGDFQIYSSLSYIMFWCSASLICTLCCI